MLNALLRTDILSGIYPCILGIGLREQNMKRIHFPQLVLRLAAGNTAAIFWFLSTHELFADNFTFCCLCPIHNLASKVFHNTALASCEDHQLRQSTQSALLSVCSASLSINEVLSNCFSLPACRLSIAWYFRAVILGSQANSPNCYDGGHMLLCGMDTINRPSTGRLEKAGEYF